MNKLRGFESVSLVSLKDSIDYILPFRGSSKSAGYYFASPVEITIAPKSKKLIWTNIKSYMQEGEVLMLYVRSSIGIKKGLRLANTTGIIDMDYYNNPANEGNIGICLYNDNDTEVTIEKGERIAQGIFTTFLVADNGNTDAERNGGIGSTNESK